MATVRTIVDSRIRIPLTDLRQRAIDDPDALIKTLTKRCEHSNPAWHKAKALGFFPPKHEPPKIVTWCEDVVNLDGSMVPCLSFPRGVSRDLRRIFREHGLERELLDRRTEGDPHLAGDIPDHNVELRGYQRAAVDALIAGENCVLRAPTGCGKTTIAFGIAAELKLPTLVLVDTSGLARQWVERAQKELGMRRRDVGLIQASTYDVKPLTIGMQKTVANIMGDPQRADRIRDVFGVVIADEVQKFAARTFIASIDPFEARYRIGISADERRKDRKEFLIVDEFGRVEMEIDRRDLINQGAVLDVEVVVVPTEFRTECDPQRDTDGVYREMVSDVDRNALLLNVIAHEAAQKQPTLVFSHRVEHCRQIDAAVAATGVRSGAMIGGEDFRATFIDTLEGLRSGKTLVGVGTVQAMGTGIDLPQVGVGVVSMPIASNKQLFGQVRGRVCRPHGLRQYGRLYYLWDQHVYGDDPLANLVRWNNRVLVSPDGVLRAELVDGRKYLKEWRKQRVDRERDSFV